MIPSLGWWKTHHGNWGWHQASIPVMSFHHFKEGRLFLDKMPKKFGPFWPLYATFFAFLSFGWGRSKCSILVDFVTGVKNGLRGRSFESQNLKTLAEFLRTGSKLRPLSPFLAIFGVFGRVFPAENDPFFKMGLGDVVLRYRLRAAVCINL